MSNNSLLSIGEIIDKLIIENIKIFNLRQQLNIETDNYKIIELNEKMLTLNQNRGILITALDEKLNDVISGGSNGILKRIRTC